jgi:DNA-binding NtrC family response regulator
VDVRVLAATNVDIARTIRGKRFREDLYYRLNAFTIQLLPLRERQQDIPVLMQHFIEEYARRLNREPLPISEPLLNACLRYSWPGNARELENIVKRYLILRDEKKILSQLDPEGPYVRCCSKNPFPIDTAEPSDLKTLTRGLKQQAERQAIARTLEYVNGSRKEAARLLNISSRALLYKMREYGLGRIAGESAVEAVA